MKVQDMKALLFELNNLQEKINIYRKSNEYVFVKTYGGWIREYNHLLNKYNKMYDIVMDKMSYNESDLSTTKKTVRDASVNYFVQALSNLISNVKADMQREIKLVDTKEVLPHQMRKCFKLCVNKCPLFCPLVKVLSIVNRSYTQKAPELLWSSSAFCFPYLSVISL